MRPRSSAVCDDKRHAYACVKAIQRAGYSAIATCHRWRTDYTQETWSVSSSNMEQDALTTLVEATVTR